MIKFLLLVLVLVLSSSSRLRPTKSAGGFALPRLHSHAVGRGVPAEPLTGPQHRLPAQPEASPYQVSRRLRPTKSAGGFALPSQPEASPYQALALVLVLVLVRRCLLKPMTDSRFLNVRAAFRRRARSSTSVERHANVVGKRDSSAPRVHFVVSGVRGNCGVQPAGSEAGSGAG